MTGHKLLHNYNHEYLSQGIEDLSEAKTYQKYNKIVAPDIKSISICFISIQTSFILYNIDFDQIMFSFFLHFRTIVE